MISRLYLFLNVLLLVAFIGCTQKSRENTDERPPKTVDLKIEKIDGVTKA